MRNCQFIAFYRSRVDRKIYLKYYIIHIHFIICDYIIFLYLLFTVIKLYIDIEMTYYHNKDFNLLQIEIYFYGCVLNK